MSWLIPSFLTPAFAILGLLAISLPILFHFFRRTPRGNVKFSSLMFLTPSPPRLTRRSRVDNWILLLLRALILLFIALAFGRIFFRQTDFLNLSDLPTRRIAIVVDTSASMFRGELWNKAQKEFVDVVDGLGPNDEVAVYTFDSELRTLVGLTSNQDSGAARRELIRSSLGSLGPSWRSTKLGDALVEVVDQLQSDLDNDSRDSITESQVILITDLQSGSDIRALQSFEWPAEIPLDIKVVGAESSNNATLSLLENKQGISADSKIRVKVSNVKDSQVSQFDLNWLTADGSAGERAGRVVVPPGRSRVINLQPPAGAFVGLELTGDEDDFDNRFFLAYPEMIPDRIMFVGANESVRNQLYFYLEKACASLIGKRFELVEEKVFDASSKADIVFVTGPLQDQEASAIKAFNEQGGLVCVVTTSSEMEQTIAKLLDAKVSVREAKDIDYALLTDIDFGHKIFAPFADPKFSNFSNIQFWKHRVVESEKLKRIASFDSGSLAVAHCQNGKGEFYLFASGWHPSDSQFSLSTKFVGVMMSMMLKTLTRENLNLVLGSPFKLSDFAGGENASLEKPDGKVIDISVSDSPTVLSDVDAPGIYQLSSDAQSKPLAFNLPASESRTDRLSTELLEQENVTLGTMATATEKVEKERQRRDKELESRQKLWRWMLILAMGILFVETLLSGYFAKRQMQSDFAQQES